MRAALSTALPHLWIAAFGRAALVILFAAVLGYPIARLVTRGATAAALSAVVGSGVLAVAAGLLGVLSAFTRPALLVIGLAAGAATVALVVRDAGGRMPALPRPRSTVLVAALCLGAAILVLSLFCVYTYVGYDVTSYHLPLARDLVEHHALVRDDHVLYSFFPQANEALYAVCLLVSPDPTVTHAYELLLVTAAIALTWLVLSGGGRRAGAGLAAGVLLVASPVAVHTETDAMNDAWVLVFVLAALLTGMLVLEERARSRTAAWIVVGLCAGSAAAGKYTGAVYGAIVVAALLLAAGRLRPSWRVLGLATVAAAIPVAPWYGHAWAAFGDPVYPYLTSVFGNRSGLWSAADIDDFVASTRDYQAAGLRATLAADLDIVRARGWYEVPAGLVPLSPLLLLPYAGLLLRRVRRDRVFLCALGAATASILLWVLTTPDQRHAVPITGMLAVAGGVAADGALVALGTRLNRTVALALCPIVVAIALVQPFEYVRDWWRSNGAPPSTPAAVDAYLTRLVSCYSGVEHLDRIAGSAFTAYVFRCEEAWWYGDGRLDGLRYGPAGWARVGGPDGRIDDPVATADRLQALGDQYLVTTPRWADARDLPLTGRYRLVLDDGRSLVFRVLDAQGRPV